MIQCAPRDDEQHRLLGAVDDRHLMTMRSRRTTMHALGRPDPEPAALPGQRLDLVGPDAGGVDDDVARTSVTAPFSESHRTADDAVTLGDSATTWVELRTTAP